jgi:predicted aldo/keto reductase-like oxidoreductase
MSIDGVEEVIVMNESGEYMQTNIEGINPGRRQFLQHAAVFAAGTALAAAAHGADTSQPGDSNSEMVPKKPLGSTGLQVSAMGLGGFSLADAPTLDEAKQIVREAVDAGVNFFDNAWEYHDGKSEEWMGECLAGLRDKVILMTKVCTHGRDKTVAMQQLEQSLKRLKTDHLDLWQIHECVYCNDPERHFARGGVVEALDQAKKEGKVRFVGFTGHKIPEIHLKMLSYGYPFDSVQMPLNCFDANFRSFEKLVLPEVNRRGMAALGMKSMLGGGQAVIDMPFTPEEMLSYAMSLPVAVTISGIDSLAVLHQNLAVARGFKAFSSDQMQALRQRAAVAAGDGHLELYKSSKKFDAAVGREQHHFPPTAELPL